jgi:hypothetical protein
MSINRKLVTLTAIGLLAVATPAAAYAASTHPAAPSGGTAHIWVTQSRGVVDKIILTGAIGDYGTATSINKNGHPDANGRYVRIALKRGGFRVNATVFNRRADHLQPKVNKSTCSFWATAAGPVTLSRGTGAYAGISGTIDIRTSFAGVGPRFHSGPHKGMCNLGENAAPLAQFEGPITGSGRVTF